MKIWENFKTLSDAKLFLQRKNCWTACDNCKKKWNDIEPATEHVHMTIRTVQGQTVTRFICDACLIKGKEKQNVYGTDIKGER